MRCIHKCLTPVLLFTKINSAMGIELEKTIHVKFGITGLTNRKA